MRFWRRTPTPTPTPADGPLEAWAHLIDAAGERISNEVPVIMVRDASGVVVNAAETHFKMTRAAAVVGIRVVNADGRVTDARVTTPPA